MELAGPAEQAVYTFGTSPTAALRLEEIAEYFNPPAAGFIRQFTPKVPDIALDLGCGPGFTTSMLAEATGCPDTYGIDNSSEFLGMAQRRFSNCTFLEHDVTTIPYPVTAEIMYSRFLLCHLRDPLCVVDACMSQLKPEGLCFIEEIDKIDTDVEVFRMYLSVAEGIVATQGASLFVGETLAEAGYQWEVTCNEPVLLPVINRQAASWFYWNTQTIWKENLYVQDRLDPEESEAIAKELSQMKERSDSHSGITWKLRRIVLRKKQA